MAAIVGSPWNCLRTLLSLQQVFVREQQYSPLPQYQTASSPCGQSMIVSFDYKLQLPTHTLCRLYCKSLQTPYPYMRLSTPAGSSHTGSRCTIRCSDTGNPLGSMLSQFSNSGRKEHAPSRRCRRWDRYKSRSLPCSWQSSPEEQQLAAQSVALEKP